MASESVASAAPSLGLSIHQSIMSRSVGEAAKSSNERVLQEIFVVLQELASSAA